VPQTCTTQSLFFAKCRHLATAAERPFRLRNGLSGAPDDESTIPRLRTPRLSASLLECLCADSITAVAVLVNHFGSINIDAEKGVAVGIGRVANDPRVATTL
jgi:hypothetical protein